MQNSHVFLLIGCVVMIAVPIVKFFATISSPKRSERAIVVGKRQDTGGQGIILHYVTFDLETGDRREYRVTPSEYGILIHGDAGMLETKLGTYWGFSRDSSARRAA